MAWTKIVLADELLAGDLPDDPYLDLDLKAYFPTPMRERFRAQIEAHPLRREIIVTQVVNDLVNGAGMTFWPRLADETGATAADLTRANFVAREIYASLPLRDELKSYDNKLDATVQTSMRIEMRTLVERASRWLVNNRRPPLDSAGHGEQFAGPVQATMAQLPELMTGRELRGVPGAAGEPTSGAGSPRSWPGGWRCSTPAYMLLGIVEIAQRARSWRPRTSRGCTSRSASGSGCRCCCSGSWRCRATTSGRRWRAPHSATTCTGCTPQLTAQVLRGTSLGGLRSGPDRVLGGGRDRAGVAGPPRRWSRSAPTRRATSPGCRSGCGWCAASRRLSRPAEPTSGSGSAHHEGVQQADEQEFAEFFRASWARLYRLALAVSGDPRSGRGRPAERVREGLQRNWGGCAGPTTPRRTCAGWCSTRCSAGAATGS